METIPFICIHCECVREINIDSVDEFYVRGHCSVCRSKVVINQKRLGKERIEVMKVV